MHRARDFDLKQESPGNEGALTQDLELNTLLAAMALGDEFLLEVARKSVLMGVNGIPDLDEVLYRQNILRDCLKNPGIVRGVYQIAVDILLEEKKGYWGLFGSYPPAILHGSMQIMHMFVIALRKLRLIAEQHADDFQSEGFTALFAMLQRELGEDYLDLIQEHLRVLRFDRGVLVSAELGPGNKGRNYILRKPATQSWMESWMEWIVPGASKALTVTIADRDDTGSRTLSDLNNRGIMLVANALAQSVEHIRGFFRMLQTELAFYIGCLNLHEQLSQLQEPTSFPVPAPTDTRVHSFHGLYDASLALTMKQKVVGNDILADHKQLVIITGANQGGKSTFLRSIGLAQLMMQCGMFVAADAFRANMCDRLFTHYRREEDAGMKSGKLDEELSRMNEIAESITSESMVLFSESFSATNEREGSEIARQIVSALVEERVKVFFVTHQFEFAHGFYAAKPDNALFLRAERRADGGRSFRILEGEPLQTSYGKDLYTEVFGADAAS